MRYVQIIKWSLIWTIVTASFLWTTFSLADGEHSDIEINSIRVTLNLYMLTGGGGNILASIGRDGTLLIDDQYAPLTEKIINKLDSLGGSTPKFVINTHWHGDHTGGNVNLVRTGAIIIAHEKVRQRLSSDQIISEFNMAMPATDEASLPVITFADSINFFWNGDQLTIQHIEQAHTDSDSFIYFRKANVIHTGDIYFNGFYPFVDANGGGGLAGVLAGIDKILALADDNTKIVPGHGNLSNKRELVEYRKMMGTMYLRIKILKDQGLSKSDVIAQRPSASFDPLWGSGFLNPDQWVGIIYDAIKPDAL